MNEALCRTWFCFSIQPSRNIYPQPFNGEPFDYNIFNSVSGTRVFPNGWYYMAVTTSTTPKRNPLDQFVAPACEHCCVHEFICPGSGSGSGSGCIATPRLGLASVSILFHIVWSSCRCSSTFCLPFQKWSFATSSCTQGPLW